MSIENMIKTMARDAKAASRGLRSLGRGQKDDALLKMAEKLLNAREESFQPKTGRTYRPPGMPVFPPPCWTA